MISIITPALSWSEWLPLAIASVNDQEAPHEHIIQLASASSAEPTAPVPQGVSVFHEQDTGMYDGLNRGFLKARGGILGHLNSDEQYLPGALARVEAYFQENPDVDVLAADTLVVRKDGSLLALRRSLQPGRFDHHIRMRIQTCSFFFRKKIVENGELLDPRWKVAGDFEWIIRLKSKGYRFECLREFTSVFTETENNLSLAPQAFLERRQYQRLWPWWVKPTYPALVAIYRSRALMAGCYRNEKQYRYKIYTLKNSACRTEFHAYSPSRFWPGRH